MVRIGIVGGTGYTALELIKLLLRHPDAQITRVTSRDTEHPHLGDVHTSLRDRLDLNFETLDVSQTRKRRSIARSVACPMPRRRRLSDHCWMPGFASSTLVLIIA